MWTHKTIIVPAAIRDLCVSLCEQLAGGGGSGMFTTALYTGDDATHYISSGMIDAQFVAAISDANVAFALCESFGVAIDLPTITAIISQVSISDGDAQTVIADLGLSLDKPSAV